MKDGKKLSPVKAALIEQLELVQMEIAIAEYHKEEYKKFFPNEPHLIMPVLKSLYKKQAELQRSIRRS